MLQHGFKSRRVERFPKLSKTKFEVLRNRKICAVEKLHQTHSIKYHNHSNYESYSNFEKYDNHDNYCLMRATEQ